MNTHLLAMAAALATAGTAHVVSAPPNTLPPYYVLEPVRPSEADRRLSASDPALEFGVRVKAVSGTGGGALIMAGNAKALLSPGGAPTPLTVTGRHVEVVHDGFEAAYEDDTVTIPNTNRHPALAVESYSVSSQPTA